MCWKPREETRVFCDKHLAMLTKEERAALDAAPVDSNRRLTLISEAMNSIAHQEGRLRS
jgi:hypothetical protein